MCIITEAQGSELPCCLIYRTEYGHQRCKVSYAVLSNTVSCLLERSCTALRTQCSFHVSDIAGQGSRWAVPSPRHQAAPWARLRPGWNTSLGSKERPCRQSWGCIWGCNWNKGHWDSQLTGEGRLTLSEASTFSRAVSSAPSMPAPGIHTPRRQKGACWALAVLASSQWRWNSVPVY